MLIIGQKNMKKHIGCELRLFRSLETTLNTGTQLWQSRQVGIQQPLAQGLKTKHHKVEPNRRSELIKLSLNAQIWLKIKIVLWLPKQVAVIYNLNLYSN